uniref:Uncharacterized protein n=1 Tax=Brassica oleracea var. oleracea TaxID=109376 RepID=A0A0D3BHX7_BRAOL
MGIVTKAGDWSFKAFTAGLGLATIYLTTTFSVNVYRGLSWHNAQSVSFFFFSLSLLRTPVSCVPGSIHFLPNFYSVFFFDLIAAEI